MSYIELGQRIQAVLADYFTTPTHVAVERHPSCTPVTPVRPGEFVLQVSDVWSFRVRGRVRVVNPPPSVSSMGDPPTPATAPAPRARGRLVFTRTRTHTGDGELTPGPRWA